MLDISWAGALVVSVGFICITVILIVLIGGGSIVSDGPDEEED